MSPLLPKPRFPWVALTAIVGALLGLDNSASACATMGTADCCVAIRCCRQASGSAKTTPDVARTPVAHEGVPARAGGACLDAPAGCACRLQAPTAPGSSERRIDENRLDPGHNVAAKGFDLCVTPRPLAASIPPAASPPRKSPLYLRNSRLLI